MQSGERERDREGRGRQGPGGEPEQRSARLMRQLGSVLRSDEDFWRMSMMRLPRCRQNLWLITPLAVTLFHRSSPTPLW
jgi:hypothetical protein